MVTSRFSLGAMEVTQTIDQGVRQQEMVRSRYLARHMGLNVAPSEIPRAEQDMDAIVCLKMSNQNKR
jgi:hypothetical protein